MTQKIGTTITVLSAQLSFIVRTHIDPTSDLDIPVTAKVSQTYSDLIIRTNTGQQFAKIRAAKDHATAYSMCVAGSSIDSCIQINLYWWAT
jgi:hypothetical protein